MCGAGHHCQALDASLSRALRGPWLRGAGPRGRVSVTATASVATRPAAGLRRPPAPQHRSPAFAPLTRGWPACPGATRHLMRPVAGLRSPPRCPSKCKSLYHTHAPARRHGVVPLVQVAGRPHLPSLPLPPTRLNSPTTHPRTCAATRGGAPCPGSRAAAAPAAAPAAPRARAAAPTRPAAQSPPTGPWPAFVAGGGRARAIASAAAAAQAALALLTPQRDTYIVYGEGQVAGPVLLHDLRTHGAARARGERGRAHAPSPPPWGVCSASLRPGPRQGVGASVPARCGAASRDVARARERAARSRTFIAHRLPPSPPPQHAPDPA